MILVDPQRCESWREDSLATKVHDLLESQEAPAGRGNLVRCIETHISWVFLTPKHAYKLKKPVTFDFLDFSTPELRRQACEDEVRLNGRLAPGVYLGVVPLTNDSRGRLRLGRTSRTAPVVDWLVKMRRLPEDRRLDVMLEHGEIQEHEVIHIGERLSRFYRQAPPLILGSDDYVQRLEQRVRDNKQILLEQVDPSLRPIVRRVSELQLRALHLWPDLFHDRVCDGRVIEGHGDLRPEHIYFVPNPVVLDCIEFSPELRQVDVADELSFLEVECQRIGAGEVGHQIARDCLNATEDHPDLKLLCFYRTYRATVRAKVATLRAVQVEEPMRRKCLQDVNDYLRLADACRGDSERPFLLVVAGPMGVGKSTLAESLAETLGIQYLSTDGIRRGMFGASRTPAGRDEGIYQSTLRDQVYDELFQRAERFLQEGLSVVLDGTFVDRRQRQRCKCEAALHRADFRFCWCRCPLALARQRIAERIEKGNGLSEARPSLLRQEDFEIPSDLRGAKLIEVDTLQEGPLQTKLVLSQLASA